MRALFVTVGSADKMVLHHLLWTSGVSHYRHPGGGGGVKPTDSADKKRLANIYNIVTIQWGRITFHSGWG